MRIERWVLQLQPCVFTVKYLLGQMNIANALSYLSNTEETTTRNVAEEYMSFVANAAVSHAMTVEEIEEESAVDEEL